MNLNKEIITIRKSIKDYLKWKSTHTEKAESAYKIRLELFEHFLEDKSYLQEVEANDIVAFHRWMQTKQYSNTTIAYSARILRNFFGFWKGRGQTTLNPKEIISIRFVSKQKDIVELEDFEDMIDLLDESYTNELQKKLVLHLLWDTGMRVSELLDLKLSDIREQHENKNGLRTAKIKTRKTNRYNLVVWSKTTDELLNKYLGWRLTVDAPTDLVLISTRKRKSTNKGISPRTIQRWVNDLSDMAGIDKELTPHSFRHGKAHNILDKGGSAVDVQAILRHRNLNSSLNYMQLNESQYLKTASKFLALRQTA